jgi:hypothetical protein
VLGTVLVLATLGSKFLWDPDYTSTSALIHAKLKFTDFVEGAQVQRLGGGTFLAFS